VRESKRERQIERKRERARQRERESATEREREKRRQREGEGGREREGERERVRKTVHWCVCTWITENETDRKSVCVLDFVCMLSSLCQGWKVEEVVKMNLI